MNIKPREARRILCTSKHIITQTFVIPVTDGAVTGYYFSNPRQSELAGVVPLIIFCHGGGWVFGNMEFYSIFLSHLAEVTGASILLVDYRLAPKYKFPTAAEDCYDALVWALEGARYWKADPDRIYIAGDSAGATLAAVTAIMNRDRKGPQLAGQILLYPITDYGYDWENREKSIKSNREYWIPKIERNIRKDIETNHILSSLGYTVIRVWEHEIRNDLKDTADMIMRYIEEAKRTERRSISESI